MPALEVAAYPDLPQHLSQVQHLILSLRLLQVDIPPGHCSLFLEKQHSCCLRWGGTLQAHAPPLQGLLTGICFLVLFLCTLCKSHLSSQDNLLLSFTNPYSNSQTRTIHACLTLLVTCLKFTFGIYKNSDGHHLPFMKRQLWESWRKSLGFWGSEEPLFYLNVDWAFRISQNKPNKAVV